MIAFLKEYDGVLSAVCDMVCTLIMILSIRKNSSKIDDNKHRIEDLETIVCPTTGKRKKKK